MRRNWFYWLVLIFVLGLIVLVPRGSTNTQGKIELTEAGTPSLKFSADKSVLSKTFLSKLEKKSLPEIYSEVYSKKDYFFVVYHKYQVKTDLTGVGEAQLKALEVTLPGLLTISMPGAIIKTNAPRISGKTAIWALSFGKNYKLEATSRYIRWWALVLLGVSLLLLIYFRITLRKRA